MREQKLQNKLIALRGGLALTLALTSAYCVAVERGSYEVIYSEILQDIQAGSFVEYTAQELTTAYAESRTATEASPIAGASVSSVTGLGNGLYNITGVALDQHGNPACALALASGRCMFTCGANSLRCEGGTADLPFGEFELTDLPTEANGDIVLQVFVQGHISYTEVIGETARWGAFNGLSCTTSSSTLAVTIDGVTKRSEAADDSEPPTWEGWATTLPGLKAVNAEQTAEGCPPLTFSFTSQELLPDRCYLFSSETDTTDSPVVRQREVDCSILP